MCTYETCTTCTLFDNNKLFFCFLVFDTKKNKLCGYYVCEFIHTFIDIKLVAKDIHVCQ